MPAFLAKNPQDILRHALQKLASTTPLTAVAPGSIVRALAEAFTNELGDLYALVDFNTSMAFLSTAQGRALDLIGGLYNVERKTLTQIATIDQTVGSFYFYIDSPYHTDIVVPAGTQVSTATEGYIGSQYVYQTTEVGRISAGRTRVYVGIRPAFSDSVFTAGANTLTRHTFPSPVGTTVKSTNPKPIQAQVGYETDDSYRARIAKSVRVSAGGTEEALRFAALAVAGVRDVRIRTAPYGLGSFEAVVTPENVSLADTILIGAASAMGAIRPVGTRMFVKVPTAIPVEINATVVLRDVSGLDRPAIARRVEIGALRYLNSLLAGSPLIYNQLLQAMLEASEFAVDVVVTSFRIDAAEALRRNVTVKEDEQLVPGAIRVSF